MTRYIFPKDWRQLWELALGVMLVAVLAGQTQPDPDWQSAAGGKMAFEVASVKPVPPGPPTLTGLTWFRYLLSPGDAKPPGGRFSGSSSLVDYIYFAWKLHVFQSAGLREQLPKWANGSYVIEAKAEGNPTKDQMRLMMQSLLADRFKLRAHFETRIVPVLALVLVKPGKLGPKLIPHSEGPACPEQVEDTSPFAVLPTPQPGVAWPPQCGGSAQRGGSNGTWLGSRDTTMALAANDIYALGVSLAEVDRPVVDRTGLQGRFDFTLELPPGLLTLGPRPPNPNPANPNEPSAEPGGALLPTALRDQLGLKLERSRGEVRTLIIDHIEQPSEN